MAGVQICGVRKVYASTEAIRGVDITMEDGSFVVLVGPSGCGKSTLLRMIAGLEDVSAGEIRIGNRVVNDVPPKERDIAMVFQSYALYPHMRVYDNMAFGLRLRGVAGAEIARRVERAAGILGLSELLERYPRELSGGQRQRVAMGRAIVRDPQVFLFDEPLSNLDAKLRAQMRTEIKELHQRLGTTSIYVTHDQVEAMTMGQKVVVLRDGAVAQIGEPLEVYDRPANLFVAGFIGSPGMNLVEGRVRANGQPAAVVASDGTAFPLPAATAVADGTRVVYGIRPEHLTLEPDGGLDATVRVVEPTGMEELVVCTIARQDFKAVFRERYGFRAGTTIRLSPRMSHIHLFDATSGARIAGDRPQRGTVDNGRAS